MYIVRIQIPIDAIEYFNQLTTLVILRALVCVVPMCCFAAATFITQLPIDLYMCACDSVHISTPTIMNN